MFSFRPIHGLASLSAVTALSVSAQMATAPAPVSRPAASSAQQGPYKSAFQDYRPYTDDKLSDWKESNDTVGAIGGWRAYAKQAQQATTEGADSSSEAGTEVRGGNRKPEGSAK